MVQYKDRQAMAVIKGVEDNFEQLTSIDSLLYGTGKFILNDSVVDYGFMGVELVSELGTGIQFVDPLRVYAPKRNVRVNIANPAGAFNQDYLFSPGAVFVVNQQKYDSRYILTPLRLCTTAVQLRHRSLRHRAETETRQQHRRRTKENGTHPGRPLCCTKPL